jgi:transaldolase
VDELIGPDTVNTIPPATLESFMDHGRVAETLAQDWEAAREHIANLADLGIDLQAITHQLQEDGVIAFAKPFDALMQSIEKKRERLLGA